jgi:hypothetical protein
MSGDPEGWSSRLLGAMPSRGRDAQGPGDLGGRIAGDQDGARPGRRDLIPLRGRDVFPSRYLTILKAGARGRAPSGGLATLAVSTLEGAPRRWLAGWRSEDLDLGRSRRPATGKAGGSVISRAGRLKVGIAGGPGGGPSGLPAVEMASTQEGISVPRPPMRGAPCGRRWACGGYAAAHDPDRPGRWARRSGAGEGRDMGSRGRPGLDGAERPG